MHKAEIRLNICLYDVLFMVTWDYAPLWSEAFQDETGAKCVNYSTKEKK